MLRSIAKIKSLNSAKLLSLGKRILIQSCCYPLAPCCLDIVAVSGGGTCVGVPIKMFLTFPQWYFPQCVSDLPLILSSDQTVAVSSFVSRGKTVQKQKTQLMIVLEKLAAAHCSLQHSSFHTLQPTEKVRGFSLVVVILVWSIDVSGLSVTLSHLQGRKRSLRVTPECH